MPLVIPGGTRVTRGDPDVVFGQGITSQLARERQLQDIISNLQGSINDPLVRQQLAEEATKDPLLSSLLPFDPGVVLQGTQKAQELEATAEQAAQRAQVEKLLDSVLGTRSVDLGGGPPATPTIAPGQTEFSNIDLPPEAPQTVRESLDTLFREGVLNPADVLSRSRQQILTDALRTAGLGGSRSLDMLRLLLQQQRAAATEAGRESRFQRKQEFTRERDVTKARQERATPQQLEAVEERLSAFADAGASDEEVREEAAKFGMQIIDIQRGFPGPLSFLNDTEIRVAPIQSKAAQQAAGSSAPVTGKQGQPRQITEDEARSILQEAGGDPKKARQLANDRNLKF